jgi:hypothetical protein
MTVFKLPEPNKPQQLNAEQLELGRLRMHLNVLAREIDDMNIYFKTVNSVVLSLAQYIKIPPGRMAEIMADPIKVARYETDVVEALKLLSAKKTEELAAIKNKKSTPKLQ